MVGWDGCECDGLVSNTLSLSVSATSTHLSMVSHSPVCFKSHCVCCHFNQCVGAAVLSHFCSLSNLLLIGNCHFFVGCIMSCVCVGFVGVCWVTSCGGVWGVDDAVCVSLSTPKKRQHSTQPCLHVTVCTNASCMVGERVSVSVCCGGVVGAGKKGKRQRHSQTKTKRTFPKTTFSLFPFFHLFFIHSFLLAFHSSTIIPFLSIHSPVFHALHMGTFVQNQKHQ